jgi:putative FmdB family regulatory protein
MPLYEYECEAEKTRFEVIQKFSDAPVATCPTCGAPVRRLLSSPAIQFKGSGWYITDYARKGGSDAAKESPAAKGKDGSAPASSPATSTPATPPSTTSSKD